MCTLDNKKNNNITTLNSNEGLIKNTLNSKKKPDQKNRDFLTHGESRYVFNFVFFFLKNPGKRCVLKWKHNLVPSFSRGPIFYPLGPIFFPGKLHREKYIVNLPYFFFLFRGPEVYF